MRHISSRLLEVPEGVFDMDINKLPISEKEDEDKESLFNKVVYKRSFEHHMTLTKLQALPKIQFDFSDPKVHQLNMTYPQDPNQIPPRNARPETM